MSHFCGDWMFLSAPTNGDLSNWLADRLITNGRREIKGARRPVICPGRHVTVTNTRHHGTARGVHFKDHNIEPLRMKTYIGLIFMIYFVQGPVLNMLLDTKVKVEKLLQHLKVFSVETSSLANLHLTAFWPWCDRHGQMFDRGSETVI